MAEKEVQTPLQKRLTSFSKKLAWAVLAICVIIFGFGLLRGEPPALMFLTAVSLAVAAIPEALPTETAFCTLALTGGLDKRNVDRQHPRVAELPFDSERKRMTTFHDGQLAGWEGGIFPLPKALLRVCSKIRGLL